MLCHKVGYCDKGPTLSSPYVYPPIAYGYHRQRYTLLFLSAVPRPTHRWARSVQKTLLNLGAHFRIDKRYWRALCSPIEALLKGQLELVPLGDC